MADTVSKAKDGRERSIPVNIDKLVHIDEDKKSDEDHREASIKKFPEEE